MAALLPLMTLAVSFRLSTPDFSSITLSHSRLWHGCEKSWIGLSGNYLMGMSSFLFLQPDAVPDLGLCLRLSLSISLDSVARDHMGRRKYLASRTLHHGDHRTWLAYGQAHAGTSLGSFHDVLS